MSGWGSLVADLLRRLGAARAGVVAVALVVVACGGGGSGGGDASSSDTPPPAVAMVDMQVLEDGFAFANFPSTWYPEEFEAQDLVAMFGANESVCVGGVADPCELTAEAAAFARMVNQSRAAGHCEGLAVVAQARFNETAEPPTSALMDDAETIRAIMRGFATQFIPEVREEVGKWLKTSLEDKVAALANSLAEGKIVYSLGVYDDYGGHAILPYAVEYRTPDQVRIMVYDSNWPGRNRWVDVDLDEKKWSFSFSGDDPDNDPDIWIGEASRMDLTSIDARNGSCPFCEGSVGVAKNALLVRSSDPNWSVEVGGETVTATSPAAESGDVEVTPFKAQTAPGERPSYDYLIQIPISPEGERAKLNFPGTASVFALTPSGIAQISTPGNPEVPIEVGPTSFVSSDPAVTLSLAAGNLVASASGPTASLEIKPEGLTAAVTTEDGQVVEVAVTPETPAAKIEADPESGGIQVLAQAATGVVERRDIASDGSVTVTIETTPLNLNATTWEAPAGLESVANPSLPSPDARNLANPDYKPDAPYTPPAEAVPAKEAAATPASAAPASAAPASAAPASAAPATAAPATQAPATQAPATQAPATQPPATQAPATQAPATQAPATQSPATQAPATQAPVTQPPATSPPVVVPPPPPTTAAPQTPSLTLTAFDPVVFGVSPFPVTVSSNSSGLVTLVSSNSSVVTISATGPRTFTIAVLGAGTTTISANVQAASGFTQRTITQELTVAKATQSAVTVTPSTSNEFFGQWVTLSASGGSTGGTITYTLTDTGGGACTLSGNQLTRSTTGSCTVTATRAGNDNHEEVTSAPHVIEFIGPNQGGVLLYQVTTPRHVDEITYSEGYGTGATEAAKTFDSQGRTITRVIYYMQVRVDGVLRFAEVSFAPWEGLTAWDLRIPNRVGVIPAEIQRIVNDMTVVSNMSSTVSEKSTGVTNGSGRRGYLEIWPWNYDTWPTAGEPTGSNNHKYDFNDSMSIGGRGYGSFQVHDITGTDPAAYRTIMAWNRHWTVEHHGAEIGLGSYKPNISGRHPDWTFTVGNDLGTDDWKLQIRVESTAPPQPVSFTASDCTPVDANGTETQDGIPPHEKCENAFESPEALTSSKKLYDGSGPFLYWVDLGATYELTGFQVWTANDAEVRDPTSVKIFASSEARTRIGDPLVSQAVTCPPERNSACMAIAFAPTSAQRYLVIEFPTVKTSGHGFQISRAIFSGVSVSAQAGASTVSTSNDDEARDETDESIDESVPEQDESIDENDESGDLDDPTSPDPSEPEPNDDDEIFVDGGLLVGVLALGARADNSPRQAKRKRRTRHWRTR